MDTATKTEISECTCDELCDWLWDKVDLSVVTTFREQGLNGMDFVELTDDKIKEMLPLIGQRKSVTRCLAKFRNEPEQGSSVVSRGAGLLQGSTDQKWVHTFPIPDKFSFQTMEAIDKGTITKSARIEIIHSLHDRMMQHTYYPTPEEYKIACWRLIGKYKTLQDTIGTGIGTWKEQLKQKFRNSRRGEKNERKRQRSGNDDTNNQPASKKTASKPGLGIEEKDSKDCNDEEVYQSLLERIAEEETKTPRNGKRIKTLMRKTFINRRKWIVNGSPAVDDILQKFPSLKRPATLHRELTRILNLDKANDFQWAETNEKIFKYMECEAKSRPSVKSLFEEYKSYGSDIDENTQEILLLKLLSNVLASRAKHSLVTALPDHVDIETELRKAKSNSASILIIDSDEKHCQYFIYAEKAIFAECCNMPEAIITLIATYFAFNMSYPPSLYSVFIFIQHHLLGLKDKQRVPNNVNILFSAISKF